jgi:hypothetical protein
MKTRVGRKKTGVTRDNTKVVSSKNNPTGTTEDQLVVQSLNPSEDITVTNHAEEPFGKVCDISMLYRTQKREQTFLNILFYV